MNELREQAESLQNHLIGRATGGSEDDADYSRLRQIFISDPTLEPLLPRFVRTCRSLHQFWGFIQPKFSTYAERRTFIWAEFEPLLDYLEKGKAPSDVVASSAIQIFDSAHVQSTWSKALDRRQSDPEGAITLARSLLESVCKHILDEFGVSHSNKDDLPNLYKKTAKSLNLAPSQHTEDTFKQILSGCTSVVQGLGALRNKLGDSHGKGKREVKPAPRHAELAVNLAGAMASFLIATLEHHKEIST